MTRGAGHWTVVGLSIAALLALVSLRWLTTPDPLGHGTHEQLMAKKGLYQRLFQLQAAGYSDEPIGASARPAREAGPEA